ncbi:MAG: right-handed parallel beta-helix repeat-containing protein, partial [Methanosarcinaceae archaeon]
MQQLQNEQTGNMCISMLYMFNMTGRTMDKIIILLMMLCISTYGVSAATTYVDTDGSGDYNCDGIDDHIEINWALSNASSGDIVHINASTYWIDDSIWINNTDITLEGDGDASTLKLPPNLSWAQSKRMTYVNTNEITIQNIRFDGNTFNQTAPLGSNYHVLIEILATHHNTTIQRCTLKDTRDDAIIPSTAYNLLIDDCYFLNVNHGGVEGSYYDSIISNNVVYVCQNTQGMNSGFRLYHGSNNSFTNNTIRVADGITRTIAYGFEIHAYNNNNLSGNTFEDNTVEGILTRAFHFDAATSSTDLSTMRDIKIRNNVVDGVMWDNAAYGQGIYVEGLWNNWIIENNVIYNSRCGVEENPERPSGGNIVIKNNIIASNREYGIQTDTSNLILGCNDVWGNAIANYNGISAGIGDISADPLFADPINHDFHLRSEYGRCDDATWLNDGVTSPCIGAGEPKPDGTRTNMGAYGNTIEASKGASDGVPLVTSLQSDTPTQNTITLHWDCSALDIDQYTIHKDGVLLDTTENKYYGATNLAPDTTYTFEVSATDKGGITGD